MECEITANGAFNVGVFCCIQILRSKWGILKTSDRSSSEYLLLHGLLVGYAFCQYCTFLQTCAKFIFSLNSCKLWATAEKRYPIFFAPTWMRGKTADQTWAKKRDSDVFQFVKELFMKRVRGSGTLSAFFHVASRLTEPQLLFIDCFIWQRFHVEQAWHVIVKLIFFFWHGALV